MTYSSRRKEVDMKKVIMIIAVAAILVGCKGKGTRVQISDSVDKFKVEKLFVVDSITVYRFYDNLKSATIIQYTIKGRFMSR